MKKSIYKKWMSESYLYEAGSHGGGGATRISGKGWQNKGGTGAPRDMHQSNRDWMKKSTDDWWDGKSPEEQKAYIKAHPGTSRKVTAKKSDGDDSGGTKKGVGVFDPEKPADEPSDMDTEKPDDEPDEMPKPKREPVKVNYDGKSGEKGSTGKGATGRWAAWHGHSGKSAGFDQPEAAEAWASGVYDDPEDAIKVGHAALEKRRTAAKKEAADIKKEVENAPPEAKSWYEEKVGSKIDKVLDFLEDLQSNEGDGKE